MDREQKTGLIIIANCNTNIAKMNASRAVSAYHEAIESDPKGNHSNEFIEAKQNEKKHMEALERENEQCLDYIAKNGTHGITLIEQWYPAPGT